MSLPRPVALAALVATIALAPAAQADPGRVIEQGVIDFQTGRFSECIQRFQSVLTPGSPDEVKTQEQRSFARMHLGACMMANRRETEADAQFEKLILEDYRFAPDRGSFPVPIIGRFLDARLRLRDKIEDKIRADQEREAELRRLLERQAQLERDRQMVIEQMARDQTFLQKNSRLVALFPLGVGQFQNRQRALGWTLLGAEAVFAATSAVSYLIKQNIENQFSTSIDRTEALRLRDLAWRVNYLSFAAFALTTLGGVAHAQLTFVPEFRETRERPLPAPIPPPPLQPVGGVLMWQGKW